MPILQAPVPKRGYLKARRERLRRMREQTSQEPPLVPPRCDENKNDARPQPQQQQGKYTKHTDEADISFAFEGFNPCVPHRRQTTSSPSQRFEQQQRSTDDQQQQKQKEEQLEREYARKVALEKQAKEEAQARVQVLLQELQTMQTQHQTAQDVAAAEKLQTRMDALEKALPPPPPPPPHTPKEEVHQDGGSLSKQPTALDDVVVVAKPLQPSVDGFSENAKNKTQPNVWKQQRDESENMRAVSEKKLSQHSTRLSHTAPEQKLPNVTDIDGLQRVLAQRMQELETQFQTKLDHRIQVHELQVQRLEWFLRKMRRKLGQRVTQLQHALVETTVELKTCRQRMRKQDRMETRLRGQIRLLQDQNDKSQRHLLLMEQKVVTLLGNHASLNDHDDDDNIPLAPLVRRRRRTTTISSSPAATAAAAEDRPLFFQKRKTTEPRDGNTLNDPEIASIRPKKRLCRSSRHHQAIIADSKQKDIHHA